MTGSEPWQMPSGPTSPITTYRDRRKIVDLWGGYRDGHIRAPWEKNAIVPVASTTKGMAAMAVAVAWGGELYAGGEADQVYRIDQSGNVAQIARLEGFVAGVTLDGMGNLYVCDTGNGRGGTDRSIRRNQRYTTGERLVFPNFA